MASPIRRETGQERQRVRPGSPRASSPCACGRVGDSLSQDLGAGAEPVQMRLGLCFQLSQPFPCALDTERRDVSSLSGGGVLACRLTNRFGRAFHVEQIVGDLECST